MKELGIGIFRVESADHDKGSYVVTVAEDPRLFGYSRLLRGNLYLRRGIYRRPAPRLLGKGLPRKGSGLLGLWRPSLPFQRGP